MECFWATTLAASRNTTIVVIGNHSRVKAGVVEREDPDVKVGATSMISYLSSSVSDFRSLAIALRSDNPASHFGRRMGDWFR
jgi:hypothetical protein